MTLKMNRDRASGLFSLMTFLLSKNKPENIAESLVEDIFRRVFIKLRTKLEGPYSKNYNLRLTPEEAKAYWIYFSQHMPENGFTYENNIVRTHCHLIDQHYG